MESLNEKNLPFVQFPDAASRERLHDFWNNKFCYERGFVLLRREEKEPAFYARLMEFGWEYPSPIIRIRGVDISLNATTLNEVLELPEVSNAEYEAKLREMDLEWLRDTLVEPTRRDKVYWPSAEGINSADWSPDAKRWLHLVGEDLAAVRRRIGCPITTTTLVSPSTALELEMFRQELRQERRKGLARDRLLVQIRKAVKIMFTCVSPGQEIAIVDTRDFHQCSSLKEAMIGLVPPEELDSDTDTSQSQGS
uniref:Putative plant transposon protein domain-containing protein n=1 Tax=Solanum tuberosum TaxID=4113 RepID=M1DCS3_SOLTU